jgi:outer membrane murein-binding lipoprotein Lpp
MKRTLHLTLIAAAALAVAGGPTWAQSAREAELLKRMDALSAELEKLKAEVAQLKNQPAQAAAPASAPGATVPAAAESAPTASAEPATVLTSYGEINFNHYTKDSSRDTGDVRRFVLGLQHRFDARTKLVTELEVEHAVSSADDSGEVEVEQAFIERQLNNDWAARAGLFLMPVGLLNENHEPTAFYGVERNFVETRIIPSTWREGGVQAVGTLGNGLTLQAGISTGFNMDSWDFTSDSEGRESPLASVHQEMQQAKSRDPAFFGALNWRGVPGLLVGGSLFTGNGGHGSATRPQVRVTLWDLHARYTPGAWDLSALVSQGYFSNSAAFNQVPEAVGGDTLLPSRFGGWYVQGAYKAWRSGDYALAPFVRYERFNTASAFADIGQGLTPAAQKAESVWTAGLNFNISEGVVIKADYQTFHEATDDKRLNLGLGWSF